MEGSDLHHTRAHKPERPGARLGPELYRPIGGQIRSVMPESVQLAAGAGAARPAVTVSV